MLWIKIGDETQQAVGYNIHRASETEWELWITRPMSGKDGKEKTKRVKIGTPNEITELKIALDYAVKNGYTIFEIT